MRSAVMKFARPALLSAAVLVTLAGCGKKQESRSAATASLPALKARVETVAPTKIPDSFWAVGTVHAKTTAKIAARIMGTLREVRARTGEVVAPGQTLAVIDDRDLTAQLHRAEAGLEASQRALEEVTQAQREAQAALEGAEASRQYAADTLSRYRQLFQEKSVSPHEFEGVRAKARGAEAQVEQARARLHSLAARREQAKAGIAQARAGTAAARVALGYATIRAPFRGVVVEKNAEVGDMAAPGRPLFVLEELGHHRLEVGVGETDLTAVRRGQSVTVRIDALGERKLSGRVSEIVPAADPASRTFTVKIDLPPLPALHSGLYGRASFSRGEKEALLVPTAALVTRGQIEGVFVVDAQNRARLRIVRTGRTYDGKVEILAGLAAGERILASNVSEVRDGARVEALP